MYLYVSLYKPSSGILYILQGWTAGSFCLSKSDTFTRPDGGKSKETPLPLPHAACFTELELEGIGRRTGAGPAAGAAARKPHFRWRKSSRWQKLPKPVFEQRLQSTSDISSQGLLSEPPPAGGMRWVSPAIKRTRRIGLDVSKLYPTLCGKRAETLSRHRHKSKFKLSSYNQGPIGDESRSLPGRTVTASTDTC